MLVRETTDLLEAIVAATRQATKDKQSRWPSHDVERRGAGRLPRRDAFKAALAQPNRYNILAECKRRSPSRGLLRLDYDPAQVAERYVTAGAAAVSVLTESAFFDGSLEHLEAVRIAVDIPVLRKDFIVSEYQLLDARAAGADAVLLIVAALNTQALRALTTAAHGLGLAVLTEVHDRRELDLALEAGTTIVGVNNRNLRTLAVDLEASHSLIEAIPEDVVAVAESGLRTPADLTALKQAGYDAFLIGEALMVHPDPGDALCTFLSAVQPLPRGSRPAGRVVV